MYVAGYTELDRDRSKTTYHSHRGRTDVERHWLKYQAHSFSMETSQVRCRSPLNRGPARLPISGT